MLKSRLALIVLMVTIGALGIGSAPASARAIEYGVAPQGDLGSRDFAKMHSSGVDVLRVFIVFPDIKPVPPVANYDFSGLDKLIGDAARHRIRALPFIVGSPSWVPHGSQDPPDAWSEFVAAVVARYGGSGTFWSENPGIPRVPVKAWQIWNEQNSRAFYFSKPSPRSYASLLRAASTAIHSQDPQADVVLGGMAELAGSSKAKTGTKYLRALYRIKGIKRYFDAIAVHAYAKEASVAVDQVERFRREMLRAHDRGAGLWVTEIGWSSAKGGSPLAVGRSGQASRLRESFGKLAREKGRLGLRGIVWYSWADSRATICDWCAKSGLVTGGGRPKPAYRQYKRAAR
jgi:hypothetical protein